MLEIRNEKDEIEYWLTLISPLSTDHQKFYECIRYIKDSDSPLTAKILRQPELWFHNWPASPVDEDWSSLMTSILRKVRNLHLSDRLAGPRGSVAECATIPTERAKFIKDLVNKLQAAEGKLRSEIALTLGEMGGPAEAEVLRAALLDETYKDRKFKLSVISALANLGGPLAVDTLLQVAESNPENLGAAALSSLEFLSSGGSTALTEAPEPPKIDSPELRAAYEKFVERLYQLSRSRSADEYVRHKADQWRQDIMPALHGVSADVA